jgi:hypothetical protein
LLAADGESPPGSWGDGLHVEAQPSRAVALPPQAAPYLNRLRDALAHHRATAAPEDLEAGFGAARAVVASVTQPRPDGRPDVEEMRRLAAQLAEFGEFVSVAADEAGRLARVAITSLWAELGLRSPPPAWTPPERDAARMLFACACAPGQDPDPARLRDGLRALAAGRLAGLLAAELAGSEDAWERALGDRYQSVRHRCAPRTTWRSRGLSELLREDERSRAAVTARLARWLAGGGAAAALGAELEAALVHARTPPRFA